MRLRIGLILTSIVVMLMVLPTTGANFTDATSSDGNEVGARRPIRVTTYQIGSGVFAGTAYDLVLTETLSVDYFVIMRGAAGVNNGSTHRTPDQNYARVSADPFGNFAAGSTGGSVLRLSRGNANGSAWQGQITVVESLDSHDTAGFHLRGVAEPILAANATAGNAPVDSAWTSIGQVGLYGGYQGGGVSTTATTRADHLTAWGRAYPSGTNTANIERRTGWNASNGRLSGTTIFSVYAVEWGSEWTIQRVTVAGNNAGNGINNPSEYNTAGIAQVARANTFVLASGISDSSGLGRGWEGTVFTLGNGVNQNVNENSVAIGAESVANRKAEMYVHTHPQLAVDYRFGRDGSIATTALTGTQTVDAALVADTYGGYRRPDGRLEGSHLHELLERNGHGLSTPDRLGPTHRQYAGHLDAKPVRAACGLLAAVRRLRRDLALIGPVAPPRRRSSSTGPSRPRNPRLSSSFGT